MDILVHTSTGKLKEKTSEFTVFTSEGSNSPIITQTFWSIAGKLDKISTIPFRVTSRTISAIITPNLVQIGQLKVPENTIFCTKSQVSGYLDSLFVKCQLV